MRLDLHVILMIVAIVCFMLSAFGVPTWNMDRARLTAAGLGFWALATLVG
jgi:hypothetical protein